MGAADSIFSATTDATGISRDSSNTDGSSTRGQSVTIAPKSNKDKNLHGQIEDLLTALSELQRDHAILATQLQREREEREEDRVAVRSLLDGLSRKISTHKVDGEDSEESQEIVKAVDEHDDKDDRTAETPTEPIPVAPTADLPPTTTTEIETETNLSLLLDRVEFRFSPNPPNRRSSLLQSKSQLRDDLTRTKEQLIIAVSASQEFSRRLDEQGQELTNLRDQVREGHTHVRNAHAEKQRLEKQIHDLRVRKSIPTSPVQEDISEWPSRRGSTHGGLRELKLGRSGSQRAQVPAFTKRMSSLHTTTAAPLTLSTSQEENEAPTQDSSQQDVDALVLELVQAKTAEAVAKQEAEEAKAKLESLRKMLGMGSPSDASGSGHKASPSVPVAMLKRADTTGTRSSTQKETPPASAVAGGFWGGVGEESC